MKEIEIDVNDQKHNSLTINANIYTVNINKENRFYVIDTPGLNDVDGIYADDRHIDSIANRLKELCDRNIMLTTILFFYNGQKSKILDIENYILESFKIFFDKELNMYFISTHTDDLISSTLINNQIPLVFDNPYVLNHLLEKRKNKKKIDFEDDDEYKLKNIIYEQKIEINKKKFLNILSIIICSNNYNIPIDNMVKIYELYITIKKEIEKLSSLLEMSIIKYDYLYSLLANEKNKKDPEELFEQIIENHIGIIKDEKYFRRNSHNKLSSIFCRICGSYISYQSSELYMVGKYKKSNSVIMNCQHNYPTDFVFILDKNPDKIKIVSDLLIKVIKEKNERNSLIKNIKDSCVENIEEIEKVLKEGKIDNIHNLLDNLHKETMINNFKDFLTKKLDYIKTNFLNRTLNKDLKKIQDDYIKRYDLIIKILFEKEIEIWAIKYKEMWIIIEGK